MLHTILRPSVSCRTSLNASLTSCSRLTRSFASQHVLFLKRREGHQSSRPSVWPIPGLSSYIGGSFHPKLTKHFFEVARYTRPYDEGAHAGHARWNTQRLLIPYYGFQLSGPFCKVCVEWRISSSARLRSVMSLFVSRIALAAPARLAAKTSGSPRPPGCRRLSSSRARLPNGRRAVTPRESHQSAPERRSARVGERACRSLPLPSTRITPEPPDSST